MRDIWDVCITWDVFLRKGWRFGFFFKLSLLSWNTTANSSHCVLFKGTLMWVSYLILLIHIISNKAIEQRNFPWKYLKRLLKVLDTLTLRFVLWQITGNLTNLNYLIELELFSLSCGSVPGEKIIAQVFKWLWKVYLYCRLQWSTENPYVFWRSWTMYLMQLSFPQAKLSLW